MLHFGFHGWRCIYLDLIPEIKKEIFRSWRLICVSRPVPVDIYKGYCYSRIMIEFKSLR